MITSYNLTHQKILSAAKESFIQKGFLDTSIRDIAGKVGISSAALYKHAKNKEDLFRQIVEPFAIALKKSRDNHVKQKMSEIQNSASPEEIKSGSGMDLEVLLLYRAEVKLICNNAKGTGYENFFHRQIEEDVENMLAAVELLKRQGKKVVEVTRAELHIFVSAFYTATLEPILHDYPDKEARRCFELTMQFFMPGWLSFLGY